MMSRGAWALLLVSGVAVSTSFGGCTRNNLEYSPIGTGFDGGGGNRDLGDGVVDLAGQPPRDLAMGAMCQGTQRSCQGGSSAACVNGSAIVDRTCPMSSMCVDGYCEAPPQNGGPLSVDGRDCTFNGSPTETACTQTGSTDYSCQPFVVDPQNGDVEWACARAVGMKGRGDACTSGRECRSGFCGSNGTCFRACASDRDCQSQTQRCADVKITVEGVDVQERSCIPR